MGIRSERDNAEEVLLAEGAHEQLGKHLYLIPLGCCLITSIRLRHASNTKCIFIEAGKCGHKSVWLPYVKKEDTACSKSVFIQCLFVRNIALGKHSLFI